MRICNWFLLISGIACAVETLVPAAIFAEDSPPSPAQIRTAVDRSIPLLEIAATGSANQRTCFTCHSQALPVLSFVEARRRGIHTSRDNLQRQIRHTWQHLERGLKSYQEGRGQGGGVDTAGYALWTLDDGGHTADHVTSTVAAWLLTQQKPEGSWTRSSKRPPSEASDWTSTFLALRALDSFGTSEQTEAIAAAKASAGKWLVSASADETEDQVFRLLGLSAIGAEAAVIEQAVEKLKSQQRDDGGWSQLPELGSDAYATGTVLYALRQAGVLETADPVWVRAVQFLLQTQQDDGSWFVHSRSVPFQLYFETGFPHRADQYISTTATGWATIALLQSLPEAEPPAIESLEGTLPLDWTEADLSPRLMQAAHTFVESQVAKANGNRKTLRGDSEQADSLREELRSLLGVAEKRQPPRMEFFGDDDNPAMIAETNDFQVLQVRWPVFAGVHGEGLLLRPRAEITARIILVPDADQTPENLLGPDGANAAAAMARRLAANGVLVIVPSIVSREKLPAEDPRLLRADFTSREWVYRQAFHMGRHVIGYDIQRILSAVDWLTQSAADDVAIGIAGYGEGGLLALHAAAIDPRITATLVSGYFDKSDAAWNEPIYRNVWSRLKQFGNAEVAALIAPRTLVIEHSAFPAVSGHKGELKTPTFADVEAELGRIPERQQFCTLITGADGSLIGPYSEDALHKFVASCGINALPPLTDGAIVDRRAAADHWIQARKSRTVSQLEAHVQSLVLASESVREDYFLHKALPESTQSRWSTERRHAVLQPEKFIEAAKTYRQDFYEKAMGRFDEPLLPPHARTRKIISNDRWTAYDVVLDVHEGLFSWGVLVLPNDLKPGERRPVVVCQHGRNGVPRDTIDAASSAYNDFAARLAEQGFITFAPHNLYRGEDRYRWLDRKANSIGCTLFSFIIAQHDATLRWLDSLPFVDGNRIAFYGLSYGGETAMRVPTILEKYCLAICSGDFNQWTRKVAATDLPFSFMHTIEWEMPYWNLGQTFDYAEMAYLMLPRPFMVERGHHDGVGRDQWVAYEFAKVRWLYAQFDMADRVQIEFFQGGHSINGEGTFRFLEQLKTTSAP